MSFRFTFTGFFFFFNRICKFRQTLTHNIHFDLNLLGLSYCESPSELDAARSHYFHLCRFPSPRPPNPDRKVRYYSHNVKRQSAIIPLRFSRKRHTKKKRTFQTAVAHRRKIRSRNLHISLRAPEMFMVSLRDVQTSRRAPVC